MEWYDILVLVLGAIGGTSGLVSLYHAKPKKTSIEISNMQTMLNESHKMFDEMKDEKDGVSGDFKNYKEETMQYIQEFKQRFNALETRMENAENEVFKLKSAIYQGYRCKLPKQIEDCPVIKAFQNICSCEECDMNSKNVEQD